MMTGNGTLTPCNSPLPEGEGKTATASGRMPDPRESSWESKWHAIVIWEAHATRGGRANGKSNGRRGTGPRLTN